MEFIITPQAVLGAIGVFVLRLGNMALDTLRVIYVIRDRKLIVWLLGFVETVIFVVVIGSVLADLNNWFNIISYAAGFATGNVIGMMIETRLAVGHVQFTIISTLHGNEIAGHLRENGYAVTEIPGRGRDGDVSILHCDVLRRDADAIERIVQEADESAFITSEEIRPVRAGFWRGWALKKRETR